MSNGKLRLRNEIFFALLALALMVSAAMGASFTYINSLSESTGQLVGFNSGKYFYIMTVPSAHAIIAFAPTFTTTPVGAMVTVNFMSATTPVPLEYGINKVWYQASMNEWMKKRL